MQELRQQVKTDEKVLWEENVFMNLLPSKKQDMRLAKIFATFIILFPTLSLFILDLELFNSAIISGGSETFSIIFIAGIVMFCLTLIFGIGHIRYSVEKYDHIESWYGTAALQQYKQTIMITSRHIFFKGLDIPSWLIDPLGVDITLEKDVIACPIDALQTIYLGESRHGCTKLRFSFTTTGGKVDVPAYAVTTINQILCQINPKVVVRGEPYVIG
jgi:hypothetical protein